MRIVFKPEAVASLYYIADFVESINTPGSGQQYTKKFRKALERLAQPNVQYALCNYPLLALLNYSCSHYNDWVIAFKIEKSQLTVYEILHSKVLS